MLTATGIVNGKPWKNVILPVMPSSAKPRNRLERRLMNQQIGIGIEFPRNRRALLVARLRCANKRRNLAPRCRFLPKQRQK